MHTWKCIEQREYRVVLTLGGKIPLPNFLFKIAFDLIRQTPHPRAADLRWSDVFNGIYWVINLIFSVFVSTGINSLCGTRVYGFHRAYGSRSYHCVWYGIF